MISIAYSIADYETDVEVQGLFNTWQKIFEYRKTYSLKEIPEILHVNNLGELYEIGLAKVNKTSKKELGKYYTPEDVARVMSSFLAEQKGSNVCDVCCGTGNLIMSYLSYIGTRKAKSLLQQGRIYLYDIDELAMDICCHCIASIYGDEYVTHIHCIKGDFLSLQIQLPDDCKVISNPPYFKIQQNNDSWIVTDVIKDSKELYSSIMEKIIRNSCSAVVITPYSFLGGVKFYSLREVLNEYSGYVFSFDNIPGHIFTGRKHGIFNSNHSNSVRAAITVVTNHSEKKGFKISPLIRFKPSERPNLLRKDVLLDLLPNRYQSVSKESPKYYKCFPEYLHIFDQWIANATGVFADLLSLEPTPFKLNVSNTCRYFLSASIIELRRNGKYIFYFKDQSCLDYAYCLLNSSFGYWYWRLYDGGITYPIGLMKSIPIRIDSLTEDGLEYLHTLVKPAQAEEKDHIVVKKNASKIQENIKIRPMYRNLFDLFLCQNFQIQDAKIKIDASNCAFDRIYGEGVFTWRKII